jgi:hypothetical protein
VSRLLISFWSHWKTHHSRYGSSGRGIGSSQRPLPDNNTQHSQETDIHALCGIRTHNPSKRAAADPRLRPHGHWDRPNYILITYLFLNSFFLSRDLWVPTHCRCIGLCCTWSHLMTHSQSVGLLWTSDQPVAETSTWQHTTPTRDIHAPREIRTRNPCKRAAVDWRLRSRGQRNRHLFFNYVSKRSNAAIMHARVRLRLVNSELGCGSKLS